MRWISLIVIALFFLIVLIPITYILLNPFCYQGHFSFYPLKELILSSRQINLLKTSIFFAVSATSLALFLGVSYAVLLERVLLPARSFMAAAYIIPILIPSYIQAIVWDSFFNATRNLFYISPFWAATLCLALSYFPYITLIVVGGLQGIDQASEEAGLLQRGKFPTLIGITLPLVRPHIITGALFVFVFSIIDFGVPDIFRLRVYPVEIFVQFSGLYNEKAAIVLSYPLLIIMAFLILLQMKFMLGKNYIGFSHVERRIFFWTSGQAKFIGTIFICFILGMSTMVPLVILMGKAGSISIFVNILKNSWYSLCYSILLAFFATLIMTILAFWIAYSLERMSQGKRKFLGEYLTQLPFVMPPILLGIALIRIWNQPFSAWFYQTPLMIIMGYVAHYIPFPIRALSSAFKQIDPHLEDAAYLTTQNRIRIIVRIILPLIKKGILAAFFIGFVLSLSDLGVTLLIIPPGPSTIPIESYNFMHYGAENKVAALCLILVIIQIIFAVSIWSIYNVICPANERQ